MTFGERVQKTIKHYSRYNRTYFRNKFYDRSLRKSIESRFDQRQMHKDYPELEQLYKQNSAKYRNELMPMYQEYVASISSPIMAASLEVSIFLLVLCDVIKPQRVIDCGSGFSSFVFRYYAAHHPGTEVWSVDDSPEWLDKTAEFLKSQNMSTDNLLSLEALKKKKDISFDLILYDMGMFDVRMLNLNFALGMLSQNGVIVFDDMHGADYAFFVLDSLRKNHFKGYSAWHYTKDDFSRYAFMARHEK